VANLAHDAHPIPPEIEKAIADFGDGTAESVDATLGTTEWQEAMRKGDGAWADLKAAVAELARDRERLDFLLDWLSHHDDLEGSGVRDWDNNTDARAAIDAARATRSGQRPSVQEHFNDVANGRDE